MRLLKLVGVLSLVTIISTGCYKNESMNDNPINLFDELPIYDEEKKDIADSVSTLAGSANLTLPSNSIEVGKINEIDLNNDKKDEIVFFEKKEDIRNEVGFTVLDSSDIENNDISYMESGNKIEYANFYDLDNDGNKEIILLVQDKSTTTLTICRYENGKIDELISKLSYDKFNKDSFTKLGVIVDNLDNDNNLELVVYNYNYKTKEMDLNICNFKDNQISVVDSLTFKNVRNFEDINISVGNISSKDKALFLSLPNAEDNGYITEVVYLENRKLVNAFGDTKSQILNGYYIPFEDANNDGITNIPQIDPKSVTIDTLSTSTFPNSLIISWNKYNGKQGEDADVIFVSQIYYNYEVNFRFLIPNNLVGKLSIIEDTENKNSNYKVFNFYYNSISAYSEIAAHDRKILFTLNVAEKTIVDDTKNMNKTSNNVYESDKYIFSISDVNASELKKLDLNIEILKDYFSEVK
ncbi:hypothetical protein [Intestinibacter sp.]